MCFRFQEAYDAVNIALELVMKNRKDDLATAKSHLASIEDFSFIIGLYIMASVSSVLKSMIP